MHEAAKIAVARVQEARDAGGAAQTKWQAAQVALEAELKRGAIEGIDTELEHKLSVEVDATARLASHGVITGRIKIAETVAQHAVDAYNAHVTSHLLELLSEVEDECHSTTTAYQRGLTELAPLREAYGQARSRVANLLAIATPRPQAATVGHGLRPAPDVSAYQLPDEPGLCLPAVFLGSEEDSDRAVTTAEPVKAEPVVVVGKA